MTNRTEAAAAAASAAGTSSSIAASDHHRELNRNSPEGVASTTSPHKMNGSGHHDTNGNGKLQPTSRSRNGRSRSSRSRDEADEEPEEGELPSAENHIKTDPDNNGRADDDDDEEEEGALNDRPKAKKEDVDNGTAANPDASTARRQRSSEVAGLGLAHLGDGEDDVVAPRRSRRAAPDADADGEGEAEIDKPDEPMHPQPPHSNGTPLAESSAPQAADDNNGDTLLAYDGGEELADSEGVTRCICGSNDEDIGLMIQCESCKCWQHCSCMGMLNEEDCPDVYYCEQCRPELHIPLLRSLGALPPAPKSHKKGGGKANGKTPSSKEVAAKELREAREAVALLAQQNAQRRMDGMAPIATGLTNPPRAQRGSTSESHDSPAVASGNLDRPTASPNPSSANASANDPYASGRRSPKRRSTMNSRDSGWEAIPPGLLHDEELQDANTASAAAANGRKRKRDREGREDRIKRDEEDASPSPAPSPHLSSTDMPKRRRMSASSTAPTSRDNRQRRASSSEDEAEDVGEAEPVDGSTVPASTASGSKKARNTAQSKSRGTAVIAEEGSANAGQSGEGSTPASVSGKGKQPNQYTYRAAKDRLQATSASGAASAGRTVSPTPSPSKSGRRGAAAAAAALREGSTLPSRNGTPAPGSSKGNAAWGLPEHLSHLIASLPTAVPETLSIQQPSTRGAGSSTARGGQDAASGGASAVPSSRPSPQAYQTIELIEPPTRVRWPSKRATLPEMRKRVRHIFEYVGRQQVESAERNSRVEALGIKLTFPPSQYASERRKREAATVAAVGPSTSPDVDTATGTATAEGAATPAETGTSGTTGGEQADRSAPNETVAASADGAAAQDEEDEEGEEEEEDNDAEVDEPRESITLLEEITRDLAEWQTKYGSTAPAAAATTTASAYGGPSRSDDVDTAAMVGAA